MNIDTNIVLAMALLVALFVGCIKSIQWDDARWDRDPRMVISSFMPAMLLYSSRPNNGNYQPVEGWLVALSSGSVIPTRKFYNAGSGIVKSYTPVVGNRFTRREFNEVSMQGHAEVAS